MRIRDWQTVALVAVLWLAALLVDLLLLPDTNYPVHYTVAVVVAGARGSPRLAALAAVAVILADVYSIREAGIPITVWSVTLTFLLAICGLAVWIAIIRERLARFAREQQGLAEAAKALVRAPTLDKTAAVIAQQAQAILDVSAVQLWEADPARNEWRTLAARGISPATQEKLRTLRFDQAMLLTRSLRNDETLEIADLTALGPEFATTRDLAAREKLSSLLIQPLSHNGQVIGAISYMSRPPRQFPPRDRASIGPLGDLWALGIENAHLYEQSRQSAREAEEARARLQRFLNLVAHDLRAPLTPILGYTQLLLRRGADRRPASENEKLREIEAAARRIRRLVGDLLDAARIGADRFTIEVAPVDLAALVRATVNELRGPSTPERLIVEAPDELVGTWDADRLRQVLENLVSNALKYSPADQPVLVELRQEGPAAILSVKDHGPGMTPDQIAQLFQPFGRLEQTQSIEGTGLGLYIARGIVEALGGRIWVESELGKGSTFVVKLPIKQETTAGWADR